MRKYVVASLLCVSIPLIADKKIIIDHLQLGMGIFDLFQHKYRAVEAQVEYRWGLEDRNFRPFLSGFVTHRGSFYIAGGMAYDWNFAGPFLLTPSFGVGYYNKGGGKNLGFPLNYRSSIELAWKSKKNYRLGIQFYHLSHGSIGKRNPGEESLLLFFSIPIVSPIKR